MSISWKTIAVTLAKEAWDIAKSPFARLSARKISKKRKELEREEGR